MQKCDDCGTEVQKAIKHERAMKLPEGKTCADCVHIRRCKAFGFTWPERTSCDFYPNKFQSASS